ncbi:MAG: DUF3800 domain-containing protein [Bryobacterales bacterium]|nr:DUF3800 domain-containing protein [Bryobacterales bacterium]
MTRYAYIFLDESGNFDFGNSGTRYLVLTSVGISRPSPMWGRLDDYKYHCIESGTDIEYFHCYNDRWPVRSAVFNLIAEHLDNMRVCCVVNEKQRTAPEMREDKRLYPWMLGYLLRRALSEEQTAGAEEIIVITDTIPVTKKRRAVEKIIKQAVVSKQLPNVTYRILHHQSRSHYGLQVADYCCWAIFRKWEREDSTWYDRIKPAIRLELDAFPKG